MGASSTGFSNSSTSASATTSSGPRITDMPSGSIILGVLHDLGAALNNTKRDLAQVARAEDAGAFVGGAGPLNPASCSDATQFNLTGGRLTSGGEVVAVDPGVAYMPVHVADGAISTTFAVVGGVLHWYNESFSGGEAGFCQDPTGQFYFTFKDSTNWPTGCTSVSIVVYDGKLG